MMTQKIKALVVEDDLGLRGEVEDALGVLGHDHEWAESQQEARELIESRAFDYVLADLQIPARAGRGFPTIEYGRNLISQIQQIKGRGVLPVILMTGHHQHGLNLVRELFGKGVMDFISKPFGDGTSGKSLPAVIQDVLDQHRKSMPAGAVPTEPPSRFEGGSLAFYPDHIELDGETILERDGPGHAWSVMQVLRRPRGNGKLPRLSSPRLAKAVDPSGRLSDGAINSCAHTLRERIAETMLHQANVTVGRDDVVANLGQGYHLADWLVIEVHDKGPAPEVDGVESESEGRGSPAGPHGGEGPLTDRQHWVLDQLRDDVTLTRETVEAEFGIGQKQANRVLNPLIKRGLIEFVRKPHPGRYRLVRK